VHHCKELELTVKDESVLDTVVHSHAYRNCLLPCEAKLKELLAADPKPEGYEALKGNLDFVQLALKNISSHNAEERASKMLRVLGFDESGQAKKISELSGGLRMRVALCAAFFMEPDLLLLDEPTNHLDFPSVLWLENRLRGYKNAFVVVTHDRELLVNVATSVMLIEEKKIIYYTCGFAEFEKRKAKEDKKKADDIEKFLKKNQNVDPATPLAREKKEKKEWSDAYYLRQVQLAGKFTFPASVPLENTEKGPDGQLVAADDISVINLKDVTFQYASTGHWIFKDPINFNVTASTRVGIMGPNGAGKSTFLKLLTHKLKAISGEVVHHKKYTLAYFGQHSTAELDLELTPTEFMLREFPEERVGNLKNHLGKTGVLGDVQSTRMLNLSYSQRSCVIFSKLTFVCPHLLIMDEPTNFLDLESVDSLISACNKYKGALLLVSHNRDFLRKCAKQYLSIVPGRFNLFDDIQTAERSTYTFIAEMESGGVKGADALAQNPGGGSLHPSQKEGEEKAATIGGGAKPAAAKPVAAKVTYALNENILALWQDGKYYSATVKKVLPEGKGYQILYNDYGNLANVAATSLKKAEAVAAPAAKGGKAAAPAAGGKPAAAAAKPKGK